jgi:hypothetical protein
MGPGFLDHLLLVTPLGQPTTINNSKLNSAGLFGRQAQLSRRMVTVSIEICWVAEAERSPLAIYISIVPKAELKVKQKKFHELKKTAKLIEGAFAVCTFGS